MNWQRLKKRFLLAIAVLILLMFVNPLPGFSKATVESVIPVSPELAQPPVNLPLEIAARGCEGATSAKTNLLSARDKLNAVRGESRNLRRALDNTRTALEEVEIHLKDKRC